MKKDWEYNTIGNLCDKMNGLWKGKVGPFVNVGVIRNANFTKAFTLSFDNIEYLDVEVKQYKTRKLQKGDLIVEKSGGSEKQPVGRTVLFNKEDGEYSFSNFTSVLRIKDKDIISPEFLYKYILFVYLRGDTRKMQKATTGIHNIEFDKFLSIPVPKLSLPEQQSIVSYLDAAFAKIDAMKANAENALKEAKALFQASLKEMMQPKPGWEESTIGKVADSCLGKMLDKAKNKGTLQPYLRNLNVRWDGFDLDDILEMKFEKNEEERYGIRKGDLIICEGGEPGRCAIWNEEIQNMKIQKALHRVRPHKEMNARFLLYTFIYYSYNDVIKNNVIGATIKHLTGQVLKSIHVFYPQITEQQSIVVALDAIKSRVDRLQSNFDAISRECDALKQAILREVFEGE